MTPTETKEMLNRADALFYDAGEIRKKFLRAMGWEYKTCQIDCCWYWFKQIGKETFALGEDVAFKWAERQFCDAHPELFPED